MPRTEDTIDKGKYTQRELLILLNNNVEGMGKKMEKLSDDYIQLHVRVSNMETRYKIVAAAWGIGCMIITIIINILSIVLK